MIKHNCTSKDHSDFVCVDPSPALPLKGREALSQMMMSYIIFLTSTNLPLPFKGRAREGSFRKHNPVINVYRYNCD
jgi:hypothetical protein